MDNKLDSIIKGVLYEEVDGLSDREDLFHRIEDKINIEKGKLSKYYNNLSSGFGVKKMVSIAACLLLVCTALTFSFSSQARVFAAQTIASIKTLFVVEEVGDQLTIVEKPASEVKLTYTAGTSTQKSDEEISQKLGINVKFPASLGNTFSLSDKGLGVLLKKEISYEKASELNSIMLKASEDDNALNQLREYNPIRYASGTYDSLGLPGISISASHESTLTEIIEKYEKSGEEESQKVKIGDLEGLWVKSILPEYPTKCENGLGITDLSQKPELKESYALFWEKSGIFYSLQSCKDFKLTAEEATKIAKDFMKVN